VAIALPVYKRFIWLYKTYDQLKITIMKKFTIILTLVLSFLGIQHLFASGINFVENKSWQDLLTQAKKEHKLIFLDGYATWCGPCKYLQQNVFTQAAVGDYYNKTFINAKIDMEAGEGPSLADKYKVTAYPTLFFIDGEGNLVHKSVGALEADDLIALGRDANDPQKQYYTVKTQAKSGNLNPAEFLEWVKVAEQMKDEDAEGIVTDYIELKEGDLLQKDMLEIVLYHATSLTEEQLTTLQQHSNDVMQTAGLTLKEFNNIITKKLVPLALVAAYKDSVVDFEQFQQVIAKYQPEKAALETQKMRVKFYNYTKDYAKCLDALAACFDTTRFKLSAGELTALVQDNLKAIVENNRAPEFIAKINQYTLLPDEASLTYYPDIALLLIYHETKDKQQTVALIAKITNNPDASERLKATVKKFVVED
jgi:thiol-disulfide isomerase/thioredoxin